MENKSTLLLPFSVKRIKILSFTINEQGVPPNTEFVMNFQQITQFNIDSNLLFFTLTVFSNIDGENIINPVLKLEVQNVFEIPNLKDYIKNGTEVKLPANNLLSIVSLSITHARALLSDRTAGTIFQDSLLPIVNPIDATNTFFPGAFENNEAKSVD